MSKKSIPKKLPKEKPVDLDAIDKEIINYMLERQCQREEERMKKLKESLHVYKANIWGLEMVIVAPSKKSATDYLVENGLHGGLGPMDLNERVWELPSGGYPEDTATLVCTSGGKG